MGKDKDGYTLSDAAWDVGCSFDWITPILQWVGDIGGLVTVEGTAAEMKALQAKGVRCYNQMAIIGTGTGYLWQIRKADVKRAQKVLGGAT